ncbi:MAG: LysE family translocator [Burkholderiaceae bacterium]|nr:LysE family translocator [Burkholderiaceae bacterium]
MTAELLLAFAAYALVTSITPGPNNTMLLASGVNFGFARTVPHILGVSLGFAVMLLAVGLGLGELFRRYPSLHIVLRWAGGAYLLWLAWKIAQSGPAKDDARSARPFGFLQAAGFQWLNPKCWIMATGALTIYLPSDGGLFELSVITAIYALINAPSVCVWAGFGVALRRWLTDPRMTRLFNLGMAALLVGSLYPLFSEAVR